MSGSMRGGLMAGLEPQFYSTCANNELKNHQTYGKRYSVVMVVTLGSQELMSCTCGWGLEIRALARSLGLVRAPPGAP